MVRWVFILHLDGAAVDWISNKLYWTDAGLNTVDVLDLSDGYHATLISTGSSSTPQAIVVDPQTRYMVVNITNQLCYNCNRHC